MKRCKWTWFNGRFTTQPKIPVNCQWSFYGLGVFEGIRFYKTTDGRTAIFRLHDHMRRFMYSMDCLKMRPPFSGKELAEAIVKTIKRNKIQEGYIRPCAGFTEEAIGLHTSEHTKAVTCTISVWDWPAYFSKPLRLKISRTIRPHPRSLNIQAKITGHYVNSRLAKTEAEEHGYDDALLLDHKGHFAEASVANIFMRQNETIITPNSMSMLPGITRETVMLILTDANWPIVLRDITRNDLWTCEEAFLCGTAAEIMPVVKIDDSRIGNGEPGEITKELQKIYSKAVRGEIKEYKNWLTYI